MSDTKRFNSVKPKQLASDLTSSSSALKLTEIKDWGGTNDLTAGQFSDYIPATLINDARTRVEFVLLTASTIANYATAGITIYKRGLKYYAEGDSTDIDEVTANKLAWTAGETKVLLGTNPPNLYGQFANKDNDETITGKYTFPEGGSANAPVSGTVYSAPTDDLEYSPKKYIDDIAIAGSPDMTVTVKGIAEEATEAEIDADTGAGATTARLAVNPSTLATSKYGTQLPTADEKAALAGTSGSPSTLNKYITEDDVEEDGLDQTQTTQDADVNCGEADATTKYNAIAQSFVADKTSIAGVKLWKEADDGAFTGTVTVDLLSDGGGDVPVAAPVLATVTLSNVAWLALSDSAEFTATFGSAYSATIGTKYWIKISTSTADNTNFINIGTNSAGGYSTGSVKFYNVTDDWTAIATIDLYFKTMTTLNSKVVRADSSGKIDEDYLQMTTADATTLTDGSDADALHTHDEMDSLIGVGLAESKSYYNFIISPIDVTMTGAGTASNYQGCGGGVATSNTSCSGSSVYLAMKPEGGKIPIDFGDTKQVVIEFTIVRGGTTGEGFFGLSSGQTDAIRYDDQTLDAIGFSFNVADCYGKSSNAGTGHTETVIAGVDTTARNLYRIEWNPGVSGLLYVNGVLEATMTTNLPDAGVMCFGFNNLGSNNVSFSAPSVRIEI